MSLRDSQGKNIFAVSNSELQAGGRKNAANDDTKFLSQEGEYFLAGILDGIADGSVFFPFTLSNNLFYHSHANGNLDL